VGVPASVLAQYQSVNARADQTANLPFNQYSQQASSVAPDYTLGNAGTFVAPVNQQQQQGIQGTNTAANQAQPYYTAATGALGNAQAGTTGTNSAALGLAGQSAEQVNAQQIGANQINQFMSPYLQDVVGSEANVLNQQNQQQQAGQLGNAINSGAFGGDRTGIAAANLEQQQNLANSQIYSGLLNQGFNTALGAAQQQQGVNLQAGQANRAALGAAGQEMAGIGQTQYGEGANTASALAGLGTGAQAAGLQGAQAQMGAGTLEQQTQQAQDTAQYNQFLQQQSYPFQVDQFLANIAEGTGALSGSTTTTQQPGGFFSDERLKHDKRAVGKTFDGQTIYSYKMHGDPRTHMGLMAQEVEKKHPEAVGLAAGYKTVDYGKATGKAANQGHFRDGGVVPMRAARAAGGGTDLDAILAAQQQMYSGLGGGGPRATTGAPHGGMARVPSATMPVGNLITAQGGLRAQPTGAQNVAAMGQFYKDIGSPKYSGSLPWGSTTTTTTPGGLAPNAMPDNPQGISQYSLLPNAQSSNNVDQNQADTPIQGLAPTDQKRGGRIHRALGGDMPYSEASGLDIPDENPHNQLSKPAALPPPSPTGFQQLMSMGSGMGGAGGMMGQMGGMFGGSGGSSGLFDGGSTAGDAYGAAAASSDATIAGDLAAAGARGGRMKRDSGGAFDADSAPNSGSLGDAPDTSVAQSPALKQGAPNTSLDSVKHLALAAGEAYIGDYPGAAGQLYQTYQSTQTNNKRGGRIGKDVGGGLSVADPDVQQLPEMTVESARPTDDSELSPVDTTAQRMDVPSGGLASNDTAVAPPASAQKSSGTPLWDTIKGELSKPSNIIPIIAGLGAMGTAPTRSLGVALAAGLQGAAQSYVPTQQGLAQAQGQQIQNQMNQLSLDAYGSAMKARPSAPQPVRPPGMINADPSDPQEMAFSNYAPVPTARPDSVTQQITAMNFAKPAVAKAIGDQWDQQVSGENQRRVLGANAAYQNAVEISNAPPGHALAVLAKTNPQKAVQLQQSGADAATIDQQVRDYAGQVGLATHQYANRPTDMQNGVLIDKLLGTPVLGSNQIMTGLTPEAKQSAYNEALQPVTLGNGLPGFRYQQAGFKSPEQAVIAQDRAARLTGAAGAQKPAAVATTMGAAPATAPRNVPPGGSAATGAPPTNPILQKALADPKMRTALADPTFNLPPLPSVKDQTSQKAAADQMQLNQKNANDLKLSGDEVANASQRALQNFQAAKIILAAPSGVPITGLPGGIAAELARLGFDTKTADQRLEAVKYLTNGALGGLRTTYGAKPAMFDVKVNLEQAFPDVKTQGMGAVKDLVDSNIRASTYDFQTANRVMPYLAAGKDPANFEKWNGTYFGRSEAVNAPLIAKGTTGAAATVAGKSDYDALPSGAKYIWNGRTGMKP